MTGSAPQRGGARRAGGFQAGRVADHGKAQLRRVEQAARHRARLVQGDAADQRRAAVEVIDAELVELHLDEHRRDVPGRVEAERKRAGQIGLGVAQFGFGRAILAHALPFGADQRDRFGDPAVLGGDAAEDQPGMAVRHQRGRNAVGQPALVADLLHQAPAKTAAADDVVEDERGIPVGVVALRPGLAKADRALRHRRAADDERPVVARACLGDIRTGVAGLIAGRQAAEHAVDQPGELRRGDVADRADDQTLAMNMAGDEIGEIGTGDRRHARRGARAVLAVGMVLEGVAHPQPAGQRARVVRLPGQHRDRLAADALDRIVGEARFGERHTQQIGGLRQIALQHPEAAAEFVLPGGKTQLAGKIVEPAVIGDAVVSPRSLVEEGSGHRGGALLARRVERGAAGNGEAQGHDRNRMVLDEPGLDPAGAGHPFDRHRRGARHPRRPRQPEQRRDDDDEDAGRVFHQADTGKIHEVCSGRRIPVAELRRVKTARAAASISAGVTAPMRSGQAVTSSRLWPIASAAPTILAGPPRLSWA